MASFFHVHLLYYFNFYVCLSFHYHYPLPLSVTRNQVKKIWIGPFFDPFGPSFAKKHLYSAWPHGLAKIAIFFKTSKSSDNYSYFRLIMPISWAKKKKLLKTESTKIGHFWPWKICLFGAAFHGMEMKRVSKNGIF